MTELSLPMRALIEICAAPDDDHSSVLNALRASDWPTVARLADEQRLVPLLVRAIGRQDDPFAIVNSVSEELEKANRDYIFAALRRGAGIARLFRTLEENGFEPVCLKGVALAFSYYPEVYLRPLRDCDVLVPAAKADAAQSFLLSEKRYRIADAKRHMSGDFGHQLANLNDREFDLEIEIHRKLSTEGWPGENALVADIFERRKVATIGGETVAVPDPVSNFLHLVEHATLHHFFENGPLIFSDLHYISLTEDFDWGDLVSAAHRLHLAKPLYFVAAVARKHGAKWPRNLPAAALSGAEEYIHGTEKALFQDWRQVQRNKLGRRIEAAGDGRGNFVGALRKALTPDAKQVALHSPFGGGPILRWSGYPIWALRRLAQMQAIDDTVRLDTDRDLTAWLGSG